MRLARLHTDTEMNVIGLAIDHAINRLAMTKGYLPPATSSFVYFNDGGKVYSPSSIFDYSQWGSTQDMCRAFVANSIACRARLRQCNRDRYQQVIAIAPACTARGLRYFSVRSQTERAEMNACLPWDGVNVPDPSLILSHFTEHVSEWYEGLDPTSIFPASESTH